jgi:hypothetical protein
MFIGKQLFSLDIVDDACFNAEFSDSSDSYSYSLKTENREISSEQLTMTKMNESRILLDRKENGEGDILYSDRNDKINFKLPDNQPAVFLKCFVIQHPFLEKLYEWADGISYHQFGLTSIRTSFLSPFNFDKIDMMIDNGNIKYFNNAPALFYAGRKEFGDDFKKIILQDFNEVGYNLTDIYLGQNPHLTIEPKDDNSTIMLSVIEADRNTILFQSQMSQGMFRALSLLIQVTYNIMKKISSTILIDDIGEGLDFERSSKLIKLLIEVAEKNDHIQLIMSTNDRYVMNNVPLEYWQVIQRSGGECHVFNYRNRKEKFDEFKYMGLNNFDFLATDYLNTEWKKT